MEEKCEKDRNFFRGFLWGIATMLLVLVAGVVVYRYTGVGSWISSYMADGTAEATVKNPDTEQKLEQLAELIDANYYKDVQAEQIEEGIYRGLLDSLGDRYSEYYDNEEYQTLQDSTSGSYFGIGAVLSQDEETMQVSIQHVYEGTPAKEAGLKSGDMIQRIDEIVVQGQKLSELTKHIKGEEGSTVHLVVWREGEDKELEFDVERRKVEVPTVEYRMLDGEVGYLKISEFSDVTSEQFRLAIEDLSQQGMAALMVDVRDNPGGVLDGASEILDQILPEGLIVYTEDKYGNRKDYKSTGDTCLELPIAVLVNENSASAAEIFAGAIKDYEYGTLIGTRTYGKGIVQQIIPFKDGSAVKITIARYFTPLGNYIHEVGIEPDVELEYEYLGTEDETYNPMYDNQVLKALEILQSS